MANNVRWMADLFTVTLVNPPQGVTSPLRWTTADFDLSYGGNTYLHGIIDGRTDGRQSSRLEVDVIGIDVLGAVLIGTKTVALLSAQGFFDDARVQVDHLFGATPADISLGPIPSWFEGRIAGINPTAQKVTLQVKSELEALNINLPKFLYTPSCMHAVYDANCGLSKAAETVTKTVITPGTWSVTATAAEATGYFDLGVAVFTGNVTPALYGVRRAVKAGGFSTGGTFTFQLPLPIAPAAGDTFTIYPGCDRTFATCQNKFANLVAFRGFPHLPPPEHAA